MIQNVYISGNISYVTGTVNDVLYTWTLTGDHIWSTDANRSSDDIYRISLTIINTSGEENHVSTIAYYGLHLITDRTQSDVDLVNTLKKKSYTAMTTDEQTTWNSDLKGSYNASDVNRVGAAIDYIAEQLKENGYSVTVDPKINWLQDEIPSETQLQKYLDNVTAIKTAFYGTQEIPQNMQLLTYDGANNIEKALLQVENYLLLMLSSLIHRCGMTKTGGYNI